MVFPVPFTRGTPQPRVIFNNAGYNGTLGVPMLPSSPAPSTVLSRSTGSPVPVRLTFQGIIQDGGSPIPEGWSVTNAVILRVVP